jgi:hypothetical protein
MRHLEPKRREHALAGIGVLADWSCSSFPSSQEGSAPRPTSTAHDLG